MNTNAVLANVETLRRKLREEEAEANARYRAQEALLKEMFMRSMVTLKDLSEAV